MTEEGYGEVITLKCVKVGPRHIGKEMPTQKGDIWRGGLAVGGEANREVLVRNSELRTVDRSHQALPLWPQSCHLLFWRTRRNYGR